MPVLQHTTNQATARHPGNRYWADLTPDTGDRLEAVAEGYMDVVIEAITQHPRSLQTAIGPSELGVTCTITLLHKLNGDPEPERNDVPWRPTVGTAVHAWLEEAFDAEGRRRGGDPLRWLTERRVTVGQIAGKDVTGSCDLFDLQEQVVIDHKVVSPNSLKRYRSKGPSQQYRCQAHLYGKGFEDAGTRPNLVAICFLPAAGDLADAYLWAEPYQREIAETVLARVNRLAMELQVHGIEKALALHATDPCEDSFCAWHNNGYANRGAAQTPAVTPPAGSVWAQFA